VSTAPDEPRSLRVAVTGASGFVGRWLLAELTAHGHEVIGMPDPPFFDVTDPLQVREELARARPTAIIHLAGVAYAPDATADAATAIRVNVGGTHAVLEGARALGGRIPVLAIASSEVYVPPGHPEPLTESSPTGPRGVYGLTKLAAEALAVAASASGDLRVAVARSFNHTGPGQRPVFAIPALARRIVEARGLGSHVISAGNIDVERDFSDVRDVVRAYRLLIEALSDDRVPSQRPVYNVASGRPTSIRSVIAMLSELAAWPVEVTIDPALVRSDDPPVLYGDASALRELSGWTPERTLEETLRDLLDSLEEAQAG
jgi:GDP-4-dehydro-6-deoxy-D-mannose reductase